MRFGPLLLSAFCLAGSGLGQEKKDRPAISFSKDVLPILKEACLSCHKPDKKKGKLDLSTYAELMKGGKQGPPVKPGEPGKSILVEMISGKEPDMPEKGDPLKPEQVELISRWIQQGAK